MMEEIWKDLPGYRETYQVSNFGNVRTKERIGTRGNYVKGHKLEPHLNSNGYLRVSMHLQGEEKSKEYLVHRLVLNSFVNNDVSKPFVNHIDGNKLNNNLTNLERCTKSENEKHAWATGLKIDVATKGEKHGMHKLNWNDVEFIRKNHKRNGGCITTGELAKQFSVCPQTITEIVGNRIWRTENESN